MTTNVHQAQTKPEYSEALDRAAERPNRSARFTAGQYITLVGCVPYHVIRRRNDWVVVRYNQRIKDGKSYPTFGEAMRGTQPLFDGTMAAGEGDNE